MFTAPVTATLPAFYVLALDAAGNRYEWNEFHCTAREDVLDILEETLGLEPVYLRVVLVLEAQTSPFYCTVHEHFHGTTAEVEAHEVFSLARVTNWTEVPASTLSPEQQDRQATHAETCAKWSHSFSAGVCVWCGLHK